MSKLKISAVLLSLVLFINVAPLYVSAPASVSAATTTNAATNTIKVQTMDVKMVFDGVSLQPPAGQVVFMYNNTTYVPLRFMSYALQKSVAWDAKNVKVTVAEPTSSELVVIKEYVMNAKNNEAAKFTAKSVELNAVKASYVFNGSVKKLPEGQSSFILNGSLYVPLRFLSESAGNSISWNPKTKTITAASKAYQESGASTDGNDPVNNNNGSSQGGNATPAPKATPAPNSTAAPTGAAGGAGGGTSSGKVSYESITSDTEAKLYSLKAEAQSALASTAFAYLEAKDDATKKELIAKGKQQLSSFTSSFNSIVADAEQKLNNNGYSTAIIAEYRSAFEASVQKGMAMLGG
ncbi:copper amine oxidase N-terminal domain-containing protein [Paenibacillus albidus]|uniref:copper amine oxidase N-terminal domain-containing protein n=1 Tax=Paenibacillus albidus TaxID=2041023 RepID=UPI001BEA85CC|nr:copper amine oxidase N-terminal domain-containing protein [Paenibacillus albidus]MBT2290579.1 copper amine oxidase N-terminal domain-containing protein [Paenibacillus albidus]